MRSKSIYGDSVMAIQSALTHCMSDGFKPVLAIIFLSIRHDRHALSALLEENNIDVFGSTSYGEFTVDQQSEGGIVILLIECQRSYYHIIAKEIGESNIAAVSAQVAEQALETFKNPSLIVCSTGMNSKGDFFDGITLVETMTQVLGKDKTFFGGMAGDDGTFTGTYVFSSEGETNYGITAIVFDGDKIAMQGMAITGWKPLGIKRTVTGSKGTLLYSIDNKPAVEMYLRYLGKETAQGDHQFDMLSELSLSFPFLIDRGNGETLVKSPIRINHEENALVTDIAMPEGSQFWFSTPPDFEIAEEIINEAKAMKEETNSEADALLIFSCAGRPPVLGPLVNMENDGLAEVWQAPMAGFFTYGEFGRTKNQNQLFHSTACCWVTLKEK